MANYFPLFFILLVLGFIIGSSILFSKKNRMLRKLRKSPFKKVSQAQNGQYQKFKGKALFVHELTKSPLTNRDCIFYRVLVRQKRDKYWRTLIEDNSEADFFLDCKGELLLIKMDQPSSFREILLENDHDVRSSIFNDATKQMDAFLEKHNKKSENIIGLNKTLRYKEGILEHEEMVVVKGIVEWKALKEPIAGYSYSKIATLKGNAHEKLLITDLKKAQIH